MWRLVQKVNWTHLRGTHRIRRGFGCSARHRHLAGRGSRSSATGASLSSGRCCLCGFTRPGPGCKPAIETVNVVGLATNRLGPGPGPQHPGGPIGLRQQCGRPKAPASWRTPNAARPRGRRAESRQRRNSGGLILLRDTARGRSRPSDWIQSPRVEAEVLRARAAGGLLRTGTVAQLGGLSTGAPAADGRSEDLAAEGSAGQRAGGGDLRTITVPAQAHRAVPESGRGRSAIVCRHLSGATSASPCCSGRAAPR